MLEGEPDGYVRPVRQWAGVPSSGRRVQTFNVVVQRGKQLLRGQREPESARVPTGHPRHSAVHHRGSSLCRRRVSPRPAVCEQRRLLRPRVCADGPRCGCGLYVRRRVRTDRRQLHHDGRLLRRRRVPVARGQLARHLRKPHAAEAHRRRGPCRWGAAHRRRGPCGGRRWRPIARAGWGPSGHSVCRGRPTLRRPNHLLRPGHALFERSLRLPHFLIGPFRNRARHPQSPRTSEIRGSRAT